MSTSHSAPLTDEPTDLPDNIVRKIDVHPGACWEWKGAPTPYGYGVAYVGNRMQLAHRGVWQFLVGPIPKDLELDHLCRNRICVNPDHLELVTRATNMRRGVHRSALAIRSGQCQRGHTDWVPNGPSGTRCCRTCRILRRRGEL